MNCWIILLLLLGCGNGCGNNCGNGCCNAGSNQGDCGCRRDRDCECEERRAAKAVWEAKEATRDAREAVRDAREAVRDAREACCDAPGGMMPPPPRADFNYYNEGCGCQN